MKLSTIASALIGIAITTFAPVAQAAMTTVDADGKVIARVVQSSLGYDLYAQKTQFKTKEGRDTWCLLNAHDSKSIKEYSANNVKAGASKYINLQTDKSNSICDNTAELFTVDTEIYKGYEIIVYESIEFPGACFGKIEQSQWVDNFSEYKETHSAYQCDGIKGKRSFDGIYHNSNNDRFAQQREAYDKFLQLNLTNSNSVNLTSKIDGTSRVSPGEMIGVSIKLHQDIDTFNQYYSTSPFVKKATLMIRNQGNDKGVADYGTYDITHNLADGLFDVGVPLSFKSGDSLFSSVHIEYYDGREFQFEEQIQYNSGNGEYMGALDVN